MQVTLLNHTPNPQTAIAAAARLCYAPVSASELVDSMTEEQVHRVLRTVITGGHHSTLEHASYTFAIDGVSRALTHQLVRHRMASYNQQSQRYVSFEGGVATIEPPSIEQDPQAHACFTRACEAAQQAYRELAGMGIPAEDARYLLPNAAETKIVVTMNARELMHFFTVRCCRRAQWEIRGLAERMLELVRPSAPYVFLDAGAPCRRGACPEGKMSCGQPFERIVRD